MDKYTAMAEMAKNSVEIVDALTQYDEALTARNHCINAIYNKVEDRSIWAICEYMLKAQRDFTESEMQLEKMGIPKQDIALLINRMA